MHYNVIIIGGGPGGIFSAYELASYAAGPQEFHFSYEQLASYWSESGRAVLGLN